MSEHKIFKTSITPVVLIGLKHFTHNLPLSIIAGIGIYIIASYIDEEIMVCYGMII